MIAFPSALIAAATMHRDAEVKPREGTVTDQHGSVFCEACLTRLTDRTLNGATVRDCPVCEGAA